ncbi:hypothetical protein [Erwinia rhapontici]|uniref:hypothetical protein n=1 Tax=Erwinia rhapontici TaxID=55212 RepID=UPI003D362E27
MKSDSFCLSITAAGWFIFCGVTTTVITKGANTPDGLVVLCVLLVSPALLNLLSRLMVIFRRKQFVLMKKRHRLWLHINPWITTGKPGLCDINGYWRALTATLNSGLTSPGHTLVLASHLLSHKRIARLLKYYPAGQYQYRTLSRPVSRVERTGLQIETLLREWRWFSPAMHCGVVVIRKKHRRH